MQRKNNDEEKKKEMTAEELHGDYTYSWVPEKGMLTAIYIFVMVFGTIFNERILLWIVATLIYFSLIGGNKN